MNKIKNIIIILLITTHISLIGFYAFHNCIYILENDNKKILLLNPFYKNNKIDGAHLFKDSNILIKDKLFKFYKNSEIDFHKNGEVYYGQVYEYEYDSFYKKLKLVGRIHFYETGEVYRARLFGKNSIQINKNIIYFNDANELYFTKDKKIIECWTNVDKNKLEIGEFKFTIFRNKKSNYNTLNIEFYENGSIKSIDLDVGLTISEINNKLNETSNIKLIFDENSNLIKKEMNNEKYK